MKYCQGPKCHTYLTKDRLRGMKGSKSYQTRRKNAFYYGDNFCSMQCQTDWFNDFGDRAIDHFGRLNAPKKLVPENAWHKDCVYHYNNIGTRYSHFIVNDLLGRRIPITEQQYDSCNDDNIKDLIR